MSNNHIKEYKEFKEDQFIEQLKMGIEVEKEHTDNPIQCARIALDHLEEDPIYYTKLKNAGL
jgi:hypothetical protein